ncbi:RagB/SusD family nutrient uptake outer membrane protein [Pontibacter sp. SGAir0037]|uniref:RagB/SusD family nutrient uptake outer membrane protein n=1 Tax=Pontibacter sp. SGAir0037 TaxID=2571030 RepID=UPI0010CD6AAB|nr:RagB/SusD family nutrient uptake outer membrane protein [Pontibacter sp. SGAir0037]QCR22656.1 RagB/SusD family nutrient uptake outer membrane protein [Pontibacter sp. SGAir0037]
MKKILFYTFLGSMVMASGCEDYLDQVVDQRTQLTSVENVSELLATAYPKADYATFTEAMSDLALDKGPVSNAILDERNRNPYYFQDVQSKAQGSPDNYWNACYAAIAAANHALEAIEQAPDPAPYAAQRGEALVARAYAHFMLVTLFSKVYDPATAATDPGIPYVTEPEKVVLAQYERRTVAYVYEQIENDLTTGLPLLNNNAYRVPKYHFNTAAAHAFAARFYLFKRDYQKVVDHANQVFAGGNIEPNLRPWVSVYSNLTANEGLAIYTQASQNANLLLVETASLWARNYARYRYGMSTAVLNALFRSNNVTGARWVFPTYTQGDNHWLILKFREHFVRTDPNAEIGYPYTIFPLFTAEEVLFNRAEAYIQLNRTEDARADLNMYARNRIENYNASTHAITDAKLRSYYGTNNARQGLLAALLDFKAAEFVQEGMRWFDILRHGITVQHPTAEGQVLSLPPGDLRRVIQIPQEATLAGIQRNPR